MEISYDAETSTLKATSSSPDENSTIYLVKNDNNYNAYENIDGLWSKETLNKTTFDNALTGATAGLSDLHQLIEDSDDVDVEVTDDYYILSAEPPAGTLTSMTKQFDDDGAEEEAEDAEKGQIEFAIAKNSKKLTAMKVKIKGSKDKTYGNYSLTYDIKISDDANVSLKVPDEAKNAPTQGVLE